MPILDRYAATIVNMVRDALLLLDGGQMVRFANDAYYRAFDERPETTLGRSIFELGSGQLDTPDLRAQLARARTSTASVEGADLARSFDRIGPRCVRVYARQLSGGNGQDGFTLLAIHDVTLERTAELELNRRLAELAVSNEALSHFAGITAHDLREPLRKVRSYGELLAASAAHKLDDSERAHLSRMLAASERLRQLIDASLLLARVATGAVRRQPVSLTGLLDDVLADLGVLITESGATFHLEPLPRVSVDASLMRAVFQNLFTNAIKFSRPDVPLHVRVHGVREGDVVVIRVEDNGVGFAAEDADRIFQPFLRLHPRASYDGVGIGLAICRRVLERHEGTITAHGTPGAGAVFVLTLPLQDAC